MRVFISSAVLLLLNSLSYADPEAVGEDEEDPFLYNEVDFADYVDSDPHFIMFFAPWCGHCQSLKPTWEELSEIYNGNSEIITIAKVDCTANTKLCSDHGVTGYPTLKLYQPGEESVRYKGSRDLTSLKKFISDTLHLEGGEVEEEKPGVQVEEGLHELTSDTFDDHVATGQHFIKFFAPWCGHCKRMEPAWKELAAKMKDSTSVKIGRVDCTKNQRVCGSKGVRGYPTLIWFKDGQEVEKYQGARQLENFLSYVEKMTGMEKPAPTEEEEKEVVQQEKPDEPEIVEGLYELNVENYEPLIASGDFFIKFFAPWCGHCKRMEPAWKELAKVYENHDKVKIGRVDCTKNNALCQSNGVRGYPTLKYFRDGKELTGSPSGRDIGNLRKFVESMSGQEEAVKDEEAEEEKQDEPEIVEGLYELNNDNYEALTTSGDFFIKFFAPWCGHCKRMEPAWKELAKEYENDDKVKIGRVDCTKNNAICQSNGVRGYPTLKYFRDGKELTGSPSGRDIENLKKFVEKMSGEHQGETDEVDKQVQQEEKEEGKEAEAGGALALDDDTFVDVITTGITFVKFYAPWCGHCKRLAPTWDELAAEDFSQVGKPVRIAKVDCTKYQSVCSENEVRGYPTLKLFVDGQMKEKYQGTRTLEALKNFVVENAVEEEEQQQKRDEL